MELKLYLIIGAQLFCFILYSIPPIRLKKNKYASIILDSLYSGTLMYVFVLALADADNLMLIPLFIWGILKGQRNYILHTLNDAQNDKKIGIESFANAYGIERILKIERFFLFPIEVLSMLLFLNLILPPYNYIFIVVYVIVAAYSFYHKSTSESMGKFGFLSSINLFHEMVLPLAVLVLLTTLNIYWLIPLLLLLILFSQYKEWAIALFKKLTNF